MARHPLLFSALIVCLDLAGVHAQARGLVTAAATPAGAVTRVRFVNRSAFRRREWGLATVPFAKGLWTRGRSFGARSRESVLTPFGARWPDGSVRFARLAVRLDLQPSQETLVTIEQRVPIQKPFTLSAWTSRGLPGFHWILAIGLPGGGVKVAELLPRRIVHATVARIVVTFRARVPGTDLVGDLWLTLLSDGDAAPFEMRLTCSSGASKKWFEDYDWIDLWTMGGVPVFRGAVRRGVRSTVLSSFGPNHTRLRSKIRLYDGQAQDWWGDMVFFHPRPKDPEIQLRANSLLGLLDHPMFGVAMNWRASGALGPFGVVPADPPWIKDGGRKVIAAERARFRAWVNRPGTTWEDYPQGMLPIPGFTGDQQDFGVVKLIEIYASGLPDLIEQARFEASEEANRPVHHREADGSPVQARNHPRWVTWGGRSHFNRTISPDRLGKPFPEPFLRFNGWGGRDNEHWSSLTLASTYFLSGSWSLLMELQNEAELYLAGHTLPSQKPGWATNGIGQPRALGRTLLSMSWNFLATGRTELAARMAARVRENVAQQYAGLHVKGPVKPIRTSAPDPRVLPKHVFWKPWEESLAIVGLEACFAVTHEPQARLLAALAAKNLMTYGWAIQPGDSIIATGVGWNSDGSPLTPAQYRDREWVLWSFGTDFNLWALPATKLALRYGMTLGDKDLQLRAWLVLQHRIAQRTRPRNGGWDRFSEWGAVK